MTPPPGSVPPLHYQRREQPGVSTSFVLCVLPMFCRVPSGSTTGNAGPKRNPLWTTSMTGSSKRLGRSRFTCGQMENPRVGGSIPSPATTYINDLAHPRRIGFFVVCAVNGNHGRLTPALGSWQRRVQFADRPDLDGPPSTGPKRAAYFPRL